MRGENYVCFGVGRRIYCHSCSGDFDTATEKRSGTEIILLIPDATELKVSNGLEDRH